MRQAMQATIFKHVYFILRWVALAGVPESMRHNPKRRGTEISHIMLLLTASTKRVLITGAATTANHNTPQTALFPWWAVQFKSIKCS